jgi:hypothetical protein
MSPALFGLFFFGLQAPTAKFRTPEMKSLMPILMAGFGVFLGSLLSDILLGDGIQAEDINQAAMVALVAAVIQWWLSSRKP